MVNIKYSYIDEYKSNTEIITIYDSYFMGFNRWYYNLYAKSHSTLTKKMTLPLVISFAKFLYYQFPNLKINDFNSMHIREYIDFCKDGLNNHPKTVRKKTRAVKLFMRYLKEIKVYNIDYFEDIINPKDTFSTPAHFENKELLLLFESLSKHRYGYRDLLISKIILCTGSELSDILALKITDIDIENKTLKLKTKAFKKKGAVNEYLLSDSLCELIHKYLSCRDTLLVKDNYSSYLFLNKKGEQYGQRGFQRNFKSAIVKANLPLHYTSRTLRNTFMYNMAKVVEAEKLKIIAKQKNVKHYYAEDLDSNPILSII